MKLPKVISDLLTTQQKFDSKAYADCFSETAIVLDEGSMHKGHKEIQQWNEKTNLKYKTILDPIGFVTIGDANILTTKVSGSFEGSPIVLNYHFELKNGKIEGLKITN